MSVPLDFDLSGRGVAVTGGGGHLGRAMALGLARAGAFVVVCGRNAETLTPVAEAAGEPGIPGRIVCEPADVRVDEDLGRVLDRIERECGRVSGWVNNAYAGRGGRLLEADAESLRHDVENGLTSVMTTTRRVVERMIRGGGGSIVNIASMYGMVSPQPETYRDHADLHNPPAYGAAKAGLIQFTRYAACEFGAAGIRVNSVSPGPFPAAAAAGRPGFVEALSQRVPLGRVGDAPEIAGAVTFLVGDASSFVTGHNLVVDGGWTAW